MKASLQKIKSFLSFTYRERVTLFIEQQIFADSSHAVKRECDQMDGGMCMMLKYLLCETSGGGSVNEVAFHAELDSSHLIEERALPIITRSAPYDTPQI